MESATTASHQRCDECGTVLVSGEEKATESPGAVAVDWCPNLDCPSNRAFKGFLRVSPYQYRCAICGAVVDAYMDRVRAHRAGHRNDPTASA